VVTIKHGIVTYPAVKESRVLKHSAMKAAKVNRDRAGHGDLNSVLEGKERLFRISCFNIKRKYPESTHGN